MTCPHITNVSTHDARGIADHAVRLCNDGSLECDSLSSDQLWACVHCAAVGCRVHAATHAAHTQHPVAVCLGSEPTAICFVCDGQQEQGEGGLGLANLGNTCYLNAAVQALLAVDSLLYFFRQCPGVIAAHTNAGAGAGGQLVSAMRDLVQVATTAPRASVVAPHCVLRAVEAVNPMFSGFAQHDAQELLACVLDALHDTLRDTHNVSIISHIFRGTLRSTVTCSACMGVSTREEPFVSLPLQIPTAADAAAAALGGKQLVTATPVAASAHRTYLRSLVAWLTSSTWLGALFAAGLPSSLALSTCLATFCAPAALTGDNQYDCERCGGKRDAVKTIAIGCQPEILCLSIKRFQQGALGYASKISTQIIFPAADFDLADGGAGAAADAAYELLAVVCHRGTLGRGHYVTYAREALSGDWLCHDDADVWRVNVTEVLAQQAYCLLYRRTSISASQFCRHTLQSISVAAPTELVYISRQWMTLFMTCVSPGPVSNTDIACVHGSLRPLVAAVVDAWAVTISRATYDTLTARFGGDLHPLSIGTPSCAECLMAREKVKARREADVAAVEAAAAVAGDHVPTDPRRRWCAVDGKWVARWQAFVNAGDTDHGPPGPLSNGWALVESLGQPKPRLRLRDDYFSIEPHVWHCLHTLYGGEPPLTSPHTDLYRPLTPPPPPQSSVSDAEAAISYSYNACMNNEDL